MRKTWLSRCDTTRIVNIWMLLCQCGDSSWEHYVYFIEFIVRCILFSIAFGNGCSSSRQRHRSPCRRSMSPDSFTCRCECHTIAGYWKWKNRNKHTATKKVVVVCLCCTSNPCSVRPSEFVTQFQKRQKERERDKCKKENEAYRGSWCTLFATNFAQWLLSRALPFDRHFKIQT